MPLEASLLVLRIASALALYAFLAALLIFLARDVALASKRVAEERKSQGSLAVIDGGDILEAGRRFPLTSLTTLGRALTCAVTIPDSFASADHAHIVQRGGQWWLEDMGSRNGTILNDIPVTEAMALVSGDVIGIGRVKLRVEF